MLAQAMNESRSMPTATSFRTLPVDVLDAKRKALNAALRERGMKVSFTHLIAWAIVRAADEWPVMARALRREDGKPQVIENEHVNLGIAVDVERRGGRSLLVPCIKGADALDFAGFHAYYEDLITKTRENKLTADDFQGTNIIADQPRRARHRRLGAAADERPGDDHRRPARSPTRPSGPTPRRRRSRRSASRRS